MSDVIDEAAQTRGQPGRTSLKGVHSVATRYMRRAYRYGEKQVILRELDAHGFDHVVMVHWHGASSDQRRRISRLLSKWKGNRAKIEAAVTGAERKAFKVRPSGVSLVLPVEMEDDLGCWVRAMRAEGVPVSQQMIMLRAKAAAEKEGIVGFAASYDWLEGFKKRQEFALRTRGSQGQQPPENLQVIAEEFGERVAAEMGASRRECCMERRRDGCVLRVDPAADGGHRRDANSLGALRGG
jgi:nuclear transport factor 2 (NTF2) superfamily protein